MVDAGSSQSLILAIIAFSVTIIPAIIIHELGHFFAAKLVGISILEFGIGFPPRLGRLFTWRETDFTLNLLPIGGFVRPFGEDMIDGEEGEKDKVDLETLRMIQDIDPHFLSVREQMRLRDNEDMPLKSVNDVSPAARVCFMAAGAMANFALAIALFFIVALLGLPLKVGALAQVAELPEGSLFAATPVEPGDVIEQINGERFVDFEAFYDKLAQYQGDEIAFSLLGADTGEPYEVRVAPRFGGTYAVARIENVAEDSPGAAAGLRTGDFVTHIAGERLPQDGNAAAALLRASKAFQGRAMSLTLLREGEMGERESIQLVVIPRVDPPAGLGRIGIAVRSGFGLGDGTQFADAGDKLELNPQSIPAAIKHSLTRTRVILGLIASLPGQLLDGSLSGRDARPISIIGISKIGGELLQRSMSEGPGLILNFMAIISIFLGVGNLLPIPALDGGRIFFVLLEVLRGKRLDPRLETRIHTIGIMLLILLGVVVMVFDVIDPPSLS